MLNRVIGVVWHVSAKVALSIHARWLPSYSWRVRALVVANGSILLVRHVGKEEWNLPGGGIEPHESPQAALQRELYEELQLSISPAMKFITTVTTQRRKYRSWHKCFLVELPDRCTVSFNPMELRAADWFGLSQLPEPTAPLVHEVLKKADYRP